MTELTTRERRDHWASCWRDTVNGLIEGEIEDAKFGLRLIADLDHAVAERDESRASFRELRIGEYEFIGHEGTEDDDPQVVARYAAERRAQDAEAKVKELEEALLEARNMLDACAAEGLRAASGVEAADAALKGAP